LSVALAVPFCDLRAAHAARAAATESALLRVARSGHYVLGEEVERFEAGFSEVCAVAHAVGVANGTDALALILRAAGIGVGDEVVVPAYTAAATWMAIAQSGATPVGADVDPVSGLIDPAAASAAIGSRTAAIVAVHLFGRLAPMATLSTLAKSHGLLLVEDAAHCPGVDEGDGPAGSLGDAAAFSFYPTKPLGGLGDGGAVVTSSPDHAASVRRLRSYGWFSWQGQTSEAGVNSRLDELQAAVLRERLRELPGIHSRLRRLGSRYREALVGCPELALPERPAADEPPWHQFVVRHSARSDLREALAEQGVGTAVHYDPIPPALVAFGGSDEFPAARSLSAGALSLPFDAWLTDDQELKVCEAAAAAAAGRSPTESSGS
jgi:dTDP-3-amino-3,4,6-trideoxy-alpha-D-glucose transaminase